MSDCFVCDPVAGGVPGVAAGTSIIDSSALFRMISDPSGNGMGPGVRRFYPGEDSEEFRRSLMTKVEIQLRVDGGGSARYVVEINKNVKDEFYAIFNEIYNRDCFYVKSNSWNRNTFEMITTNHGAFISGKNELSMHSYGIAVDLNASLNPYSRYASGSDSKTVIRTPNHPVCQIFMSHGWGWGGFYHDYMHFSKYVSRVTEGGNTYLRGH